MKGRRFILAIDGGGMKGFIPALMLEEIERLTGKPLWETFDMVAGTSIGGILACLVASGHPASVMKDFFTQDGPSIFGRVLPLGQHGFFRPRYSAAPIEKVLQERLGEARLEDVKLPLIVTGDNVSQKAPAIFKSGLGQRNLLLWEIARVTSAAQTYFPPYEIDGMSYWDGGNVANNPAEEAYVQACKNWWPDDEIHILSLGCGRTPRIPRKFSQNPFNWGIARVLSIMLDQALNLAPVLVDDHLTELMEHKESYTRVQPVLEHDLAIDDASPAGLALLQTAGHKALSEYRPVLQKFVDRLAA